MPTKTREREKEREKEWMALYMCFVSFCAFLLGCVKWLGICLVSHLVVFALIGFCPVLWLVRYQWSVVSYAFCFALLLVLRLVAMAMEWQVGDVTDSAKRVHVSRWMSVSDLFLFIPSFGLQLNVGLCFVYRHSVTIMPHSWQQFIFCFLDQVITLMSLLWRCCEVEE